MEQCNVSSLLPCGCAEQSGWGDAEADVGVLNPHYQDEQYEQYR